MRTSTAIVRTYEAPRELDLVLQGFARQTVLPDEVIVADDGSGPDTAEIVRRWQDRFPAPLLHVTQPDGGFRKGQISNMAVVRSTGEELLFIDGDAIPHSKWVADHLQAAQYADVRCGRRVKMGPDLSGSLRPDQVASGLLERLFGPVLRSTLKGDTKRFMLGLRLPLPLARVFHPRPRKLMGVNFSLSREAFEAVNGFDNDWTHRRPDKDIDLRLRRSGAQFMALLNRAVVHHIYHLERHPSEPVQQRVREEEQSARIEASNGLKEVEGL